MKKTEKKREKDKKKSPKPGRRGRPRSPPQVSAGAQQTPLGWVGGRGGGALKSKEGGG